MPNAVNPRNTAKQQSSRLAEMRKELARNVDARISPAGDLFTAIPGFSLHRRTAPTACNSATYEPSLSVFVQGRKRITLGGVSFSCDENSFLLTSVDVPVVSQIVAATKEVPLLSLRLTLDLSVVREILSQHELPESVIPAGARCMSVGKTTVELLDACSRLVATLDKAEDIPFFGDMIQREILYRLLRGPQGARLRAIATLGEQSHRTAKAIAWLRTNYAKPLRMDELAAIARMGTSTLHHQFRAITAMSPLQYQKQLRLNAARSRMLMDGLDAASAAFEVGYESASQFSREYRRLFGQPPMTDVKANRLAGNATVSD